MEVKVKKLSANAILPRYATDGSGCFDLFSKESRKVSLGLFEDTVVLDTGLAFEIPEDHVMLIFSRSGHGFKHGVRLANCVGVIDSDYRGELRIKLTLDQDNVVSILPDDAIAQAMIIPIPKVSFVEVNELSSTDRGEGGFGSTDKR